MATKDLSYLGNLMFEVAKAIDADATNLQNSISSHVHYDIVEKTPVDVGTARSNWLVRLGSGSIIPYRAFSPHASRWRAPRAMPGSDRSERQNLEAARAQAEGVLSRNKTGQDVYITSNLPYIQRLNEGHSKQSPAGFVEAGIQTGLNTAVTLFRFTNLEKLF